MKRNLTGKLISIAMSALLTLSVFSGCTDSGSSVPSDSSAPESSGEISAQESSEEVSAEKTVVNVAALKGPTGLGITYLMEQDEQGTTANDYEFTLAGAADEVLAKVISGEVDIAAVPTNAASILYHKTEKNVSVLALNTLGVLHILQIGDEVSSVADLQGKTIYSSGQGAVPEYALNYILTRNGLTPGEDVTVEWKTEHSENAAQMVAGQVSLCMVPEPFVTQITSKNPDVKIALDLTKEWDKVAENGAALTMGCMIVRNDFLEEHPDAVSAFMEEYKASVEYVNANPHEAGIISEKYDILAADVAEKAIPNCNIVYIDGEEMQSALSGFLQVLYDANPQAVGGSLPDEAFYYKK